MCYRAHTIFRSKKKEKQKDKEGRKNGRINGDERHCIVKEHNNR